MASPRVLLVDDEPDILETLQTALQSHLGVPVEVELAKSAGEARGKLERQAYALVMADEKMPGDRGIDLLAWVRERKPGVTRVLMTAYAPGTLDTQPAEPHLVVKKPFDLATLLPALRELLRDGP